MRWLVSVALFGWLGTVSIGMAQPAVGRKGVGSLCLIQAGLERSTQ